MVLFDGALVFTVDSGLGFTVWGLVQGFCPENRITESQGGSGLSMEALLPMM